MNPCYHKYTVSLVKLGNSCIRILFLEHNNRLFRSMFMISSTSFYQRRRSLVNFVLNQGNFSKNIVCMHKFFQVSNSLLSRSINSRHNSLLLHSSCPCLMNESSQRRHEIIVWKDNYCIDTFCKHKFFQVGNNRPFRNTFIRCSKLLLYNIWRLS